MHGAWDWLKRHRLAFCKGAREASVGLLFAALVAPLIFALTGKAHWTLDWSQQLDIVTDRAGGALGAADIPNAPGRPPAPKSWYFIDLHGGFCDRAETVAYCPPDTPVTDHGRLARLLANVAKQGPRLIVLDVLLAKSADKGGDQAILDVLKSSQSPVLLSWIPANGLTDVDALNATKEDLLFSLDNSDAPRNARYLPAIKLLDSSKKARFLLADKKLALPTGVMDFPTVAYAAALVLASPPEHPFAKMDGFSKAREAEACGINDRVKCSDYAMTQRVFSFPRRAPHGKERYTGSHDDPFYARIVPSTNDPFLDQVQSNAMHGAVVVIGNSNLLAGDQTLSALGDVSGAEIVINDIRQYLVSRAEPEQGFLYDLFKWFVSEWPFYTVSWIIIFVVSGYFESFHPVRRDEKGCLKPSLRRATLKLAIEVTLSLLIYWVVVGTITSRLMDFVSPFVGMALQALVEFLAQVKRALDTAAESLWIRLNLLSEDGLSPKGE